ncbi:MAG: hypothetical protein HGN29_09630 [Asgard group archaeon]|nr:hypothetical protein [Asgard group archaeon]
MRKIVRIGLAVLAVIGLVLSILVIYQYTRVRGVDYQWLEGEPEDYGFKWNKIAATYLVAERMPFLRSVLIMLL